MEGDRPLTAKEKRQEQIKRWQNSATDLECPTYANPKIRVKFDDGAVFLAACSACDLDEVKALLDGGADINFANVDGLTALHQACIDGNLEVVEFLVEHGSEIDQEDNEGWTPLHATASCGFMDIAKYLVDKGANVGAVNSEAELPIDIAEEDEMVDYLQSEIDRQGIDVEEARDIEHIVMLEDAKTLLERHHNGENLELYRHPKSGATPLHITAAKGYNDALKILIKAGLDVNAIDNDGWTPLHAASHWSQEESAKILADKSANFKIRSKLGQTCFDVADEDMLEYLEELEAGQEKDAVIEPPPLKKERKSSPIVTKDPSDSIKINDIQNGEKQPSKTKKDENEESDEEKVSSLKKRTSAHSPYSASTSDAKSSQDKDRQVSIVNDVEDSSDRLSRRRPASLQISATQESSHKPLSATNSEGGSKPVAATQPVQSVTRGIKENGKTPSYTRDKEETPSSWRTGLRKTPSFEEKSKSLLNSKSETERSSSYSSRLIDETKTARVAPILDARKAKESETEDTNANDVSSGYQRTTSFSRKKQITDNIPTITTTDSVMDTTTTYKRSSVTEDANETTNDNAAAASEAKKNEDAEKRRSHLQPVRDEEAEAQRRIRSRRERQTRRSTQGVTLDVYEEAMKTIGKMKKKPADGDKTDSSSDATKSRNDSSSDILNRDDSQTQSSGTSQSSYSSGTGAGTPVTSLPSSYIPSDQRVKAKEASDAKATGLAVPSITLAPSSDAEEEKGENSTSETGSNTANRKSAAQQRRRTRKERRSTGLPDLKPSISSTEPETVKNYTGPTVNGREDLLQESGFNARVLSESPRFRRRRISHGSSDKSSRSKLPEQFQTGKVYQSDGDPALILRKGAAERIGHIRTETRNRPKLPDAFQESGVYKNDSGISAARKQPISERIKRMVQDKESLDDDEQHRRFVERLTSRIKKKIPPIELQATSRDSDKTDIANDEAKSHIPHFEKKVNAREKRGDLKRESDDEPRLALELDEPAIPTMRRREMPPRSNLVAMFASDPVKIETATKKTETDTSMIDDKDTARLLPDSPRAEDATDGKRARYSAAPVKTDTNDMADTNQPQDPSMLSKTIAACIAVCLMSAIIYFAFL